MNRQLLVMTAVAIGGSFIGHALITGRDQRHRGDRLDLSKMESAVADIQLFGSARQVELVQACGRRS